MPPHFWLHVDSPQLFGSSEIGEGSRIPDDAMTPQEAVNRANEMMDRARKNPNGELSREEILNLMNQGMALKVKYAGRDGELDSLRA